MITWCYWFLLSGVPLFHFDMDILPKVTSTSRRQAPKTSETKYIVPFPLHILNARSKSPTFTLGESYVIQKPAISASDCGYNT